MVQSGSLFATASPTLLSRHHACRAKTRPTRNNSAITASTKDISTLLQWVNRGIAGKVDSDHYASLCLASIDAATGKVEIASAGRQPSLPSGPLSFIFFPAGGR